MGPQLVTPEDHDAGFKDVELQYQRGPAPEGFPDIIRLVAPPRRMASLLAAEVQSRLASDNDPFWPVLKACLPAEFANEAFLEKLTWECGGQLIATALVLTFGAGAQKKIEALADLAQSWINSPRSAPSLPLSEPASAA